MEKHGIDTLKTTIEDVLVVVEDVKADMADGKLSLLEGATLVLKDGGKAIRFIKSIDEIKDEIIDLDDMEASELFDEVAAHFGGSDEAKAAIKLLFEGSAKISQGIQALIELKNS
jgi:hypothetical protein